MNLGDVLVDSSLLLHGGLVLLLSPVRKVEACSAPGQDGDAKPEAGLGRQVLVGSLGVRVSA